MLSRGVMCFSPSIPLCTPALAGPHQRPLCGTTSQFLYLEGKQASGSFPAFYIHHVLFLP